MTAEDRIAIATWAALKAVMFEFLWIVDRYFVAGGRAVRRHTVVVRDLPLLDRT